MKIFIPVVGQFTNVGDVLHRKQLLKWLNDAGQLHVYVGKAPQSFVTSLDIASKAVVYTSLRKWLLALATSGYKNTSFVFNPGEIRLARRRMTGEMFLYPFQLLVRLKAGKVLRIGIAAMSNSATNMLWAWKMLVKPTNQVYWRTFHSKELFERGVVIPDLAFYNALPEAFDEDVIERKYLAVSMRQDRPAPNDLWFDAIGEFAKAHDLKIILVSQVRMDNESCINISKRLNAETFLWPDERYHNEQEELLIEIYRKTKMVISDRLHVLIAAMIEGAIPVTLLTQASNKVQHHFSVINYENVSIDTTKVTKDEVASFLNTQLGRYEETKQAVSYAKSKLEEVRAEVINNLSSK